MKKQAEEKAIGFNPQNEESQTVKNPLENALTGIFANLQGDPNAPESQQDLNLEEFAEFAGSFVEGLGLGQKIKDALGQDAPEAALAEEKPSVNNFNVNITFGDLRFK